MLNKLEPLSIYIFRNVVTILHSHWFNFILSPSLAGWHRHTLTHLTHLWSLHQNGQIRNIAMHPVLNLNITGHLHVACNYQVSKKMALSQTGSIIIKGHFFLGHPVSAFLPSICIHDFEDKMKLKLIYKTLDISHKSTP